MTHPKLNYILDNSSLSKANNSTKRLGLEEQKQPLEWIQTIVMLIRTILPTNIVINCKTHMDSIGL